MAVICGQVETGNTDMWGIKQRFMGKRLGANKSASVKYTSAGKITTKHPTQCLFCIILDIHLCQEKNTEEVEKHATRLVLCCLWDAPFRYTADDM